MFVCRFYADESKERAKTSEVEHQPKAEVQGLPDILGSEVSLYCLFRSVR